MHILLYKMLDIFLVLQTHFIFFFPELYLNSFEIIWSFHLLLSNGVELDQRVLSTGLIFLHYKGNNPLSTLANDFWFSRFCSLSAGAGTVPHPVWVSHTFPSKPSSLCSFSHTQTLTIRPLSIWGWQHRASLPGDSLVSRTLTWNFYLPWIS